MPTPFFANLASGPLIHWTDDGATAYGTVALAGATFLLVFVTIGLDHRARKEAAKVLEAEQARAKKDRDEAKARLTEERQLADERLREERELAERRQSRERQIAIASTLIERITDLHPYMEIAAYRPGNSGFGVLVEAEAAVSSLQAGARNQALMLGDTNGSKLYILLVRLVTTAYEGNWLDEADNGLSSEARDSLVERTADDLRSYSRYVRLWLAQLILNNPIPAEAVGTFQPDVPRLKVGVVNMRWKPSMVPPGWDDDTTFDPKDPLYLPLA